MYKIARLALIITGTGVLSLPAMAQKPKTPVHPPLAGGPAAGQQTDPEVAKLEAAAVKAEKASKAKPKDAKLKEAAAEAYFKAGYQCEYKALNLSPRAKYRGALKLYRKALALNPKHAKATAEKKQIEDIYKQMGMPIPD